MTTLRILWISTALPFSLPAQLFSIGVQGGAPAQPTLGATSTMPFTIGPTVNLRAFSRVSLESGLLFHRFGNRTDSFGYAFPERAFTFGSQRWRGRAIEVPFLLKYRFLSEGRGWQPFVAAGPAVRRTSIDSKRATAVFSKTPLSTAPGGPDVNDKSVKWNVDPVVSAGMSFKSGKVWLEPQVRYSYWGAGKHSIIRKNQVHFLFGLRF
jgi:hypothetical protein